MRNLARLLTNQGPINWEIARQMAQWAATAARRSATPIRSLGCGSRSCCGSPSCTWARLPGCPCQRAVCSPPGSVTPREWALRTLEDWKPLLEKLASTMTESLGPDEASGDDAASGLGDAGRARRTGRARLGWRRPLRSHGAAVRQPAAGARAVPVRHAGRVDGRSTGLPGHGPVRPADASSRPGRAHPGARHASSVRVRLEPGRRRRSSLGVPAGGRPTTPCWAARTCGLDSTV